MTSLHRTPLTTSQKIECVAKALAGPEDGGGIAGLWGCRSPDGVCGQGGGLGGIRRAL